MATQIIDFYSYKGGAGRSVTTFNTLPFLAKELGATKEKPILVIDMDLDSAGITFLLDVEDEFNDDNRIGINQYFYGGDLTMRAYSKLHQNHCFLGHAVDVSANVGASEGTIVFMGVSTNDLKESYHGGTIKSKLKEIKKACDQYNFSAIVFDSASGNQSIAHAILEISDHVVVCMKATEQFRTGTFRYIEKMIEQSKLKEQVKLTILPVAIPEGKAIKAGSTSYKAEAFRIISTSADSIKKVFVNKTFIKNEDNFGIPEIEIFKWQEKNLHYMGKEKLNEKENIAYESYNLLARGLSGQDE